MSRYKNSVNSETLQGAVEQAAECRRNNGWPRILPLRVAHKGPLPYAVHHLLDPRQYSLWRSKVDNEHVALEMVAAAEGRLSQKDPVTPSAIRSSISQMAAVKGQIVSRPKSSFDPRLPVPTGAVRIGDPFYIERDTDIHFNYESIRPGNTITIRAPRQTGKSSLLFRGLRQARQQEFKVISLDMQAIASDDLATYDRFLYALADSIFDKLRLDPAELEKRWCSLRAPNQKFTHLLEDIVLNSKPVILALDEADRLLNFDFSADFFSLVRSWHNQRAGDDEELTGTWGKFSVVLVISTEPSLLIPDPTQSPFNIGLTFHLYDFNATQVRDLNQRHGAPIEEDTIPQLMSLLNGHPFLTRMALYTLVTQGLTWQTLVGLAHADHGPFGDHLRHHFRLLQDKQDIKQALTEIIQHNRCTCDEMSFFRLQRAGLVKGEIESCACRCDLYRIYFEGMLR